ncbi:ABC transporter substrate-binding protein [Holdemanella sp.]|uniref:ABC transporter substrate-binding protein n=1 Tax=Holdemanella sp. TaxID=1971762 RepID=UPI0027BA8290|nr:ABC transporter substrate-binding protein [Holdemanella sp.]
MNKQRIVAGLASVAMASTLVACSGGSSSDAKTLTVSVNQSLTGQFTPQYASSAYDQYVVNLCYESMLKYNADNELEPVLAKDLPEVSEDGLTLTYKLEKGHKFSDGTEVTAKDVKFTFTTLADPSYTGPNGGGMDNIVGYKEYNSGAAKELTGVETPDDYTVVFHLVSPQIDAVSLFGTMGIASADHYSKYKQGNVKVVEKNQEESCGSGAYQLKSYDKASGASFVRNEEFKPEKGQYQVDRIVMKKTDVTTEVSELKKGTVDLIPEVIETNKVSEASQADNMAFNYYTRSAVGFVALNANNGATADKAVRQALMYATDRQGFCDSYFRWDKKASDEVKKVKGGYVPAAYWNPASVNSGAVVRNEETIDGLNTYAFDMDKANQVLDEAGWVRGADGIREKDGQKLEIKFLLSEGNSVLETLIPIVKKTWGDLGVDLKQTTVDFSTLLSNIQDTSHDSEWNMCFLATSFTSNQDSSANDSYSNDPENMAVNNYSRINDQALIDQLTKARADSDEKQSKVDYAEAMKMAADDAGYMPVYSGMMFNLYNKKVDLTGTGTLRNWSQSMDTITVK